MSVAKSLVSGFGGAVAMTLLHNVLKDRVQNAPKIDELGMQALKKVLGNKIKDEKDLYRLSMLSDLLSNGLIYTLISFSKKRPLLTGSLLGIGIGLGTTTIPEKLGLKKDFAAGTIKTALMAIAYYTTGGLTTGALIKAFR